ncbi:MAG: 3-isopropylmalate dehydrogenase [Bacteroidales bacterium]|jgi:3-isopropylmalate dehydrogenase|nr:3-isopropylmalate dehydrogenase [Bacteroidales bacterium]
MKKKIAVLPGDGIGPEIIEQAVSVLKSVASKYGHEFTFEYGSVGACAIDECGDPFPQKTYELCKNSDAVLFGAIGDPKYDNNPKSKVRPEQGLLKMRKSLGLFANLRPIEPFDKLSGRSPLKDEIVKGASLIIVRELTGGLYFGEPRGRSESGDKAFDTCIYSRGEIERVARKAFELAKGRKNHVTLVDKANVIATSRLWREVVTDIHEREYSSVTLDFMFVDNAAMKLVTDPRFFDIVLTENLFGDILSDEASVITGSIGLLPSASVGSEISLFEPIHGSFPQAKGKHIADPIATILSAAMLLDISFGLKKEADAVRNACSMAIEKDMVTPEIAEDGKGRTTEQVGEYIAANI